MQGLAETEAAAEEAESETGRGLVLRCAVAVERETLGEAGLHHCARHARDLGREGEHQLGKVTSVGKGEIGRPPEPEVVLPVLVRGNLHVLQR